MCDKISISFSLPRIQSQDTEKKSFIERTQTSNYCKKRKRITRAYDANKTISCHCSSLLPLMKPLPRNFVNPLEVRVEPIDPRLDTLFETLLVTLARFDSDVVPKLTPAHC